MLPFASPLTTDASLGWSAAEVPRWVAQVALTAGVGCRVGGCGRRVGHKTVQA